MRGGQPAPGDGDCGPRPHEGTDRARTRTAGHPFPSDPRELRVDAAIVGSLRSSVQSARLMNGRSQDRYLPEVPVRRRKSVSRRIITAREQHAMRQMFADATSDAAAGKGFSGSPDSCDPATEDCSSTNGGQKAVNEPARSDAKYTKPTQGSNSDGFYDDHPSTFGGASGSGSGTGYGSPSSGGNAKGSGSTGTPSGGPPSGDLTQALQRAGIDPAMYPLISGFSATEGNNPSGAPTLGFTDSQAGTTLDQHAQALAKQFQDRQSVAGPFPHAGSPADQASWMATVVGQNGVSSDWQGNAQPARSDYVDRIVKSMPPPVQQAPAQQTQAPAQQVQAPVQQTPVQGPPR